MSQEDHFQVTLEYMKLSKLGSGWAFYFPAKFARRVNPLSDEFTVHIVRTSHQSRLGNDRDIEVIAAGIPDAMSDGGSE